MRRFLSLIFWFFIIASCIYSLFIAPNLISVTTNDFGFFGGDGEPVRIVFISDVHYGSLTPGHLEKAVARINELEPDVVLVGGDVIHFTRSELGGLDALGEIEAGRRYVVLGNHDYGSWGCPPDDAALRRAGEVESQLESLGFTVLRNENEVVEVSGRRFAIAGVDDEWSCMNDYSEAAGNLSATIPKIVLVHNELGVDASEIRGRSLILAGHTHCGQVYIPFITQWLMGPEFGPHVMGRDSIDDDTDIYVTCGIVQGGVRFLTTPEISIINLT